MICSQYCILCHGEVFWFTDGLLHSGQFFCTDCTMDMIILALLPTMDCMHLGPCGDVDDAGAELLDKADTTRTLQETKFKYPM